jgi:uncharacterized RDD family membrane protein YckC
MQISSFEKRIFAYLVDFLIVLGIAIGIYIFVFMRILNWNWEYGLIFSPIIASILFVCFVGNLCYLTNGYTLGNAIFGLKMVSIKFQKLSYRQVMIKYLPLSLIPCMVVNALYMLIKHTEKTIFDELSHTVSVSMR